VTTVEQHLSDQLATRRFQTWLLSLFSLLAMILASVGIYGVMHYSVAQRTHEIGVRMALGARPGNVVGMVIGA
jgi:putative ABC transport system permease protein